MTASLISRNSLAVIPAEAEIQYSPVDARLKSSGMTYKARGSVNAVMRLLIICLNGRKNH
jgi:hypothetical protein